MNKIKCRHCGEKLQLKLIDLGYAPHTNELLSESAKCQSQIYSPLRVWVCKICRLVQIEDHYTPKEIFRDDYPYFSSTSKSWLRHAEAYSEKITKLLELNSKSFVLEVASNDGYLLKNFVSRAIPCLGVEPTLSTANQSIQNGIPTLIEFFSSELAEKIVKNYQKVDLFIGNNVYAHVPDINDFTRGIKKVLAINGVVNIEFPHLLNLIDKTQFDTIYHEHYSYLSLFTVSKIFNAHGLKIYDVEVLPTHGGSLRIYASHIESEYLETENFNHIMKLEGDYGLYDDRVYLDFNKKVSEIKNSLISFLIKCKDQNKIVVGYGAASKGVTLLNYAGVKPDLLPVVFDSAKAKQNKCLPGSGIPVLPPDQISKYNPDYIIIFPWNIYDELKKDCIGYCGNKVTFVKFIPEFRLD